MRMLAACFLLMSAAVSLAGQPQDDQTRTVVKTDSRIEFHASATFTKVVGVFHSWEADLKMPAGNFANASLDLEIDAASVATGGGFKDKEVKGKNFFDVKEYPKIRFVSKTITADADPAKFHVDAELTLRGITKPVSVTVTMHPQENGHQWLDGNFSFNRREFGMTHNVPFNKIANTITVQFHLDVTNPSTQVAQIQPQAPRGPSFGYESKCVKRLLRDSASVGWAKTASRKMV